MVVLLPRLPRVAAARLLEEFLTHDGSEEHRFEPENLPEEVQYAPTGGVPASKAQLLELYEDVMSIARECGFPSGCGHPEFDFPTAVYLAQNPLFSSGEALRDDVWSFVSIVMFPAVVRWRFEKNEKNERERYFGGVRNAFQRLWMRGRILDRGAGHPDRWGLIRDLTEDAFVALLERPRIGADPRIARHIAEAWVRANARRGGKGMQDVMRRVMKFLRMCSVIRVYPSLPDEMLAHEFDSLFERFGVGTSRPPS